MFFPEGNVRVYLYGEPVDMRKSFDGLYALARNGLKVDPLSGHLFAFVVSVKPAASFSGRVAVPRIPAS